MYFFYFLVENVLGSSYMLSGWALKPAISLRGSGCFEYGIVFKIKVWVLAMLVISGMSLF